MSVLSNCKYKHKDSRRGKEKQRTITQKIKINKIATVSPSLSVITLSVNGLNSLIKRHGVAEYIKKSQYSTMCIL